MVFAYKRLNQFVKCMLEQREGRGTPLLIFKLAIDERVWSAPRTAFLTLTDSTDFHHTCGWPVLEFVEAMKTLRLSCTNSFTATNHLSHLLPKFPSRPALYSSSYSPTS